MDAEKAMDSFCRLANGSPYIFCGDFNIKPSDAIYSLITMGEAPPSEGSPSYISYDGWSSKVPERMASAYCQVHGSEPDFTNYSVLPHQKFVDVLDYIFLSNGCQATEVRDLPAIQDISRALPNREQPSDHLMIAATVRIQS